MKKQIGIAILLATTILFNGCFSTSYMQKAPSKKMWNKSKKFQTCDDTKVHIPSYRNSSYLNMTLGGILSTISLAALASGAPTKSFSEPLALGALVLTSGILHYMDTNEAIKEAQRCSDYKTFMLSK